MKRWAFTVLFVFLACALAAGVCGAAPAEDLERKIGELEKAIEESVKSGRGLSPELMEELEKTVEELLKGEKDGDDGNGKEPVGGWEEVPFTGSITISRTLSGSAVMKDEEEGGKDSGPGKKKWRWSGKKENGKSQSSGRGGSASWSASSSASLSAMITGSEPIHDEEGNVTGYQPVGYVTGQVAERENLRSKDVSVMSKYSHSAREEHAFNPGAIDNWCKLTVNPEEGRYDLSFPSIYLGDGTGSTLITVSTPEMRHTEREPWYGLVPVGWIMGG
ncbi:MAG: hypothetical protein GX310_10370, partial [Synergistaceae bacterium]|nr:hypothetical protein [Synergistaceae bacterium]